MKEVQEKNLKLVNKIVTAPQKVEGPKLLVDVVNLDLICGIDIEGDHATIKVTLTIIGYPLSTYLQNLIEKAILSVPEVKTCDVKLVWYPVWGPERMTTAAKQQLGILGNEQALSQEEKTGDTEEEQEIIDFSVSIRRLAEEYPDLVQIIYDCGFIRIKIPGLLSTIGRVMTIPLGAQAMEIDSDKIKRAFENKGYKVIDK